LALFSLTYNKIHPTVLLILASFLNFQAVKIVSATCAPVSFLLFGGQIQAFLTFMVGTL